MLILVINSGSSSIKFQLRETNDRTTLCRGIIEPIGLPGCSVRWEASSGEPRVEQWGAQGHQDGIRRLLELLSDPSHGVIRDIGKISAVGHRVVHGGESITRAELVTPALELLIEKIALLAPLHNSAGLLGIRAVRALLPEVPQVAVFDTAFHASIPDTAFLFALPYEYYQERGIRRFGFHGISHQFVAAKAAEMLGVPPGRFRCVTCHMGAGVSFAAVRDGRSVDTTLGFGTMCGVPMATRAGDVDPAVVLHLIERLGMTPSEVTHLLYRESGLKGLSGISGDVREISAAAAAGSDRAELALRVFTHAARKYVAAMAASLGGRLDAVVFTGGIGVHSPRVREMMCGGLEILGLSLDARRNLAARSQDMETRISADGSRVAALVIPTDEEAVIAHETQALVAGEQVGT